MQPQTQPEAPAPSPLAGLLSIFYSPAEAFLKSGRNGWIVALLASCFVATLANSVIINRVGYANIVRSQIEKNESLTERLGPAGVDKVVQDATNSSFQKGMAYGAAPVAIVVMSLIYAGIAYGFLLVLGGTITYRNVLTVVAWSGWAVILVQMAGSLAAVFSMSDFSGVDISKIFGLNAGMFMADAKPSIRALAGGIDLIAFWSIFMHTLGVKTLGPNVSMVHGATVFITLHVVFTLMRAGWAAMFG